MNLRQLCLLFFVAGKGLAAQTIVPQGTWSARASTGLTLVGTWTAVPALTSETVTGTWTLVDAQGKNLANGGWSASKSLHEWTGNWRAADFGSPQELTGSWRAAVRLKTKAGFAELFEKAAQSIVGGSWRSGSHTGVWSIQAQAAPVPVQRSRQ